MKRVLITGMEGFTGRYLRDEFAAHGWAVFGFGARAQAGVANYRQVDLQDLPGLQDYVRQVQPQAVAHLAGIAFVGHNTPFDFYQTHVLGTLNLLSALELCAPNLQKVLLASSANVYGNSVPGVYSETTPLRPANDYAVSKLAMEYMAWLWRDKLPIVIARPFNYTGVGQSRNFLLPKIVGHFQQGLRQIELGNLNVERDFSDVRNVANAYRRLIECPESKGAVNVCSGQVHSIQDVLAIMKELSGYEMEVKVNPAFVRADEVKTLYGSCDRLKGFIGDYQPIELKETLRWMLGQHA